MKRCKICVFPESVPGISFDDEGVCNYCRERQPLQVLGEDKLRRIVQDAKDKKREYDCVVPISGGRDSTYVLYTARKKYDLKVLAVHFDNEFRVSQAFENLTRACEILDVELLVFRSKKDSARKIVRQSIKKGLKYGLPEVLGFCMACNYGFRAVSYRTALKYKVPLIIWGSSKLESTTQINPVLYRSTALKYWLNKFNILNMDNVKLLRHRYGQRREFPVAGNLFRNLILDTPRVKKKDVKQVSLFDYTAWDREEIEKTITSELEWKKPVGALTSWRIDCELEKLITYCFHCLFGCSKYSFGFHNMINEKQMDREEALRIEEKTSPDFTAELRALLSEKIGLTADEIDKLKSFSKKPS